MIPGDEQKDNNPKPCKGFPNKRNAMNSCRQILYHIVFCTHNRENTIPLEQQEALYKYIWGIITKRKGVLYRINGMENHIHILSDLHPTVSLADFITEIKTGTKYLGKRIREISEIHFLGRRLLCIDLHLS